MRLHIRLRERLRVDRDVVDAAGEPGVGGTIREARRLVGPDAPVARVGLRRGRRLGAPDAHTVDEELHPVPSTVPTRWCHWPSFTLPRLYTVR
jgi:hypothetical protein